MLYQHDALNGNNFKALMLDKTTKLYYSNYVDIYYLYLIVYTLFPKVHINDMRSAQWRVYVYFTCYKAAFFISV